MSALIGDVAGPAVSHCDAPPPHAECGSVHTPLVGFHDTRSISVSPSTSIGRGMSPLDPENRSTSGAGTVPLE